MPRWLGIVSFTAVGLLAVDLAYAAWFMSNRPESEPIGPVAFYGGLVLAGVVALGGVVALADVGARSFRSGRRARVAARERRDLRELLRRL